MSPTIKIDYRPKSDDYTWRCARCGVVAATVWLLEAENAGLAHAKECGA